MVFFYTFYFIVLSGMIYQLIKLYAVQKKPHKINSNGRTSFAISYESSNCTFVHVKSAVCNLIIATLKQFSSAD